MRSVAGLKPMETMHQERRFGAALRGGLIALFLLLSVHPEMAEARGILLDLRRARRRCAQGLSRPHPRAHEDEDENENEDEDEKSGVFR